MPKNDNLTPMVITPLMRVERVLIEYEHIPFIKLVSSVRPKRILEIGIDKGWGAERMIKATHEGCEYYGFDLVLLKGVRENLTALGANVNFYIGNSRQTLPREVPTLPKMDFIYIDAGKDETLFDYFNVQPLCHFKTVIVIDDFFDHRVKYALEKIPAKYRLMVSRRYWLFHLPSISAKVVFNG